MAHTLFYFRFHLLDFFSTKLIRCKPTFPCKIWKLQSESLDQHPRDMWDWIILRFGPALDWIITLLEIPLPAPLPLDVDLMVQIEVCIVCIKRLVCTWYVLFLVGLNDFQIWGVEVTRGYLVWSPTPPPLNFGFHTNFGWLFGFHQNFGRHSEKKCIYNYNASKMNKCYYVKIRDL